MRLHYLVKLIARVLLPYITYFSIQVVEFDIKFSLTVETTVFNSQQLFPSCLLIYIIHSLPVLPEIRQYSEFFIFQQDGARQLTELARRSSCWKKSRLISSNQVCGLPIILLPRRLCDMGNHAGEGLQQGEDCKCWRTSPAHRGRVVTSWSAHYRQRSEGVVKTTASVCCCWRRTVWTWTVTPRATVHYDFAV